MTVIEQKCAEMLAREKKREYQREWRRRNPEKTREYINRYWAKKGREALAEAVAAMEAEAGR